MFSPDNAGYICLSYYNSPSIMFSPDNAGYICLSYYNSPNIMFSPDNAGYIFLSYYNSPSIMFSPDNAGYICLSYYNSSSVMFSPDNAGYICLSYYNLQSIDQSVLVCVPPNSSHTVGPIRLKLCVALKYHPMKALRQNSFEFSSRNGSSSSLQALCDHRPFCLVTTVSHFVQ